MGTVGGGGAGNQLGASGLGWTALLGKRGPTEAAQNLGQSTQALRWETAGGIAKTERRAI